MQMRLKYVGDDRRFIGCTALGKVERGKLLVQVDQFHNMWSHGWHVTDHADWEPVQ